MAPFETVLIEKAGDSYRLSQGAELLLRVPAAVFERYEAETVFPPQWRVREEGAHPVRRLFWNSESNEFLMAGLEAHPARTTEALGTAPYRSFLQGFWIPSPAVLLLRPFWHPSDPYDAFDAEARETSFRTQERFLEVLGKMRPPPGWTAILNATDAYLDTLGVTPEAPPPPETNAVREVSLTPPAPLRDEAGRTALRRLAVEHAGSLFPVLREGALVGVHSLDLRDALAAEALFDALGLLYQQGPYRPH